LCCSALWAGTAQQDHRPRLVKVVRLPSGTQSSSGTARGARRLVTTTVTIRPRARPLARVSNASFRILWRCTILDGSVLPGSGAGSNIDPELSTPCGVEAEVKQKNAQEGGGNWKQPNAVSRRIGTRRRWFDLQDACAQIDAPGGSFLGLRLTRLYRGRIS
jgi:hypothetical protein